MSFHIQAPDNDDLISTVDRGNGQHNLALFLVDQLSAQQPEIEGIWLLITLPHSSTITIVPVFPDHIHKTQSLAEAFVMTDGNQPGSEFLDLLTEQILWDDFLVIDRVGISSVLNSFEAAEMDASNAALIEGAQLTLDEQVSIWQSMCDYLSGFESQDAFAIWFHQVSSNFSTNLSRDEIPLNTWGAEEIESKLGCEFPTLNLISP